MKQSEIREYFHSEIEENRNIFAVMDENEDFVGIKKKGIKLYISQSQNSYTPTMYRVFRKEDKKLVFERAGVRLSPKDIKYIKFNFKLKIHN